MDKVEFLRIRAELGCTQKDLAEILDITPRQVARFESGATIPKVTAIVMSLMLLYRTDREDEAVELLGRVFYGDFD